MGVGGRVNDAVSGYSQERVFMKSVLCDDVEVHGPLFLGRDFPFPSLQKDHTSVTSLTAMGLTLDNKM